MFLNFYMSKNSCTCTPEWIRTTNTTYVRVTGIEPITFRVSGGCSNQLSYTRIFELVKPTSRQGNSVQCFLRSQGRIRTYMRNFLGLAPMARCPLVILASTIPPPDYIASYSNTPLFRSQPAYL